MKYQLITFDVYTALVDIETSLMPPLADALGNQVDVRTLLRAWRAKQLEYAILTNSLGRATDVIGTKSAGLKCYWSNRLKDHLVDPVWQPEYEFENLSGVLEIL